jgi:CDGSH-type Zn-finger protein
MSDPIPAQKAPFTVELEAGKTYAWCRCGRSQNQPFCDGSHSGTGLSPFVFKCEENRKAALCGCKQSGNEPFCDGTHSKL